MHPPTSLLLLLSVVFCLLCCPLGQRLPNNPFLHPEKCGRNDLPHSAICDENNRLQGWEKDIIDGSLHSLTHLAKGAIAIVDHPITSASVNESMTVQATEIMANNIYNAWEMGHNTTDDRAFLMLVSIGDRTAAISMGNGLTKYITAEELASIMSNVRTKVKNEEYKQAMLLAVLEIKLLLSLAADNPLMTWNNHNVIADAAVSPSPQTEIVVPSNGDTTNNEIPFNHKPSSKHDGKHDDLSVAAAAAVVTTTAATTAVNTVNTNIGTFQAMLHRPTTHRFLSLSLLFPLAALAGRSWYCRLEGTRALQDVIADSRLYASDNDETIITRAPRRCPHCLSTLYWPQTTESSDTSPTKIVSFTPGSLPCGHIFCRDCIHRMMMMKPTTTITSTKVTQKTQNIVKPKEMKLPVIEGVNKSFEGGETLSVISTHGNNHNTTIHNKHNKDKRAIETSVVAEFCRHCPVCTTPLSDWSTTLNKIDADSALLSSLQKSSSNKHTLSRRVESLLARINRNKEISYAASRLRHKYGVHAIMEGSHMPEEQNL